MSLKAEKTGTEGNKKAADYIAGVFQNMGLAPIVNSNSYFQRISFSWTMWSEIGLNVNGEQYKHLWDFMAFPDKNESMDLLTTNEVVFLGYGIEDKKYSDYKNVDVKGKGVAYL